MNPGERVRKAGKVGSVVYIDQDYCRVCWSDGTWTWEDMRVLTSVTK